jgi:hypothetical protein
MKILNFTKNSPEWLEARTSLITGTKNKDLIVKRGTSKKKGFYQLIADRLQVQKVNSMRGYATDIEDPRARGHALESEAIQEFKKIMPHLIINDDCTLCVSEENDKLGYSPDALIYDSTQISAGETNHSTMEDIIGKLTPRGTVEVKCLDGANHIEALITKDYSDFEWQLIQGFIVNPLQQYAYLVYYNPDLKRPLHYIKINRDEVKEKITQLQEIQTLTLTEVEDWTNKILNNQI